MAYKKATCNYQGGNRQNRVLSSINTDVEYNGNLRQKGRKKRNFYPRYYYGHYFKNCSLRKSLFLPLVNFAEQAVLRRSINFSGTSWLTLSAVRCS